MIFVVPYFVRTGIKFDEVFEEHLVVLMYFFIFVYDTYKFFVKEMFSLERHLSVSL